MSGTKSELSDFFAMLWPQFTPGAPEPEREYRFRSDRRWKFDFAWPAQLVAVEVEGGVWSGGRHVRPDGFERDVEKYNKAAFTGWHVFRCTAKILKDDPAGFITMVHVALESFGEERRIITLATADYTDPADLVEARDVMQAEDRELGAARGGEGEPCQKD